MGITISNKSDSEHINSTNNKVSLGFKLKNSLTQTRLLSIGPYEEIIIGKVGMVLRRGE